VLLTVKSNQKTLDRQIGAQFQGKRHIPFTATDHERRHGRDTFWELRAKEAPVHIKANWPGSSWIVELITMTMTGKGQGARGKASQYTTGLSPASAPHQKRCCA
jgi:hypothetical protein